MMGPITIVLATVSLAISGAGAHVAADHGAIQTCRVHAGDVSHCSELYTARRGFGMALKPHRNVSWFGRCQLNHWRVAIVRHEAKHQYGRRLRGHFVTDEWMEFAHSRVFFNGVAFENDGRQTVLVQASC